MRPCAPVVAVPAVAPALDAVLLAGRVAVAVALAVRALAVPPVLPLLALPALGARRGSTSAHTTNLKRLFNADNCLRCSGHNHHSSRFIQGRTLPASTQAATVPPKPANMVWRANPVRPSLNRRRKAPSNHESARAKWELAAGTSSDLC